MKPALVADIGGTHARFALYDGQKLIEPVKLRSRDFEHPVEAVEHYLRQVNGDPGSSSPAEAVFAVASPIYGDHVSLTNSAWRFSRERTQRLLALEHLHVLNDFAALSLSLPDLEGESCRRIRDGKKEPRGAKALLGPGTGLGVGGLLTSAQGTWVPVEGEGGHVELAAATDREWEVRRTIARRHGRVSAERVLSGPGLSELYSAIRALEGEDEVRSSAAEIVERALDGSDALAREATEIFSSWLGGLAGDLALLLGARGGVYLGGGMLERMGDAFDAHRFNDRFAAKGRLSRYVEELPVDLIVDPWASLLGATKRLGC